MDARLVKYKYISNDGFSITRTNLFCSISFVFCPLIAMIETKNNVISTNIEHLDNFISQLIDFESSIEPKNWKVHHHKYLVKLDIMLDKPRKKEDIDLICKKIAEKYENLPYFAYTYNKGKSMFVRMCFCERHYNEEGEKVTKIYKYGKYIDSNTGKVLKGKRKGAIEVYKKGEVVEKVCYFTNKTKIFVCHQKSQLIAFINDLKTFLIDIYAELGVNIHNALPVKKINYKLNAKVFKPIARMWNNTFDKVSILSEELVNLSTSEKHKIGIERLRSQINSEREKGKFIFVKDEHCFSIGQTYLETINNGLYKDINFYDPNFKTVAIHYLREGLKEFKKRCELYIRHFLKLVQELQSKDLLPGSFDTLKYEHLLDSKTYDITSRQLNPTLNQS